MAQEYVSVNQNSHLGMIALSKSVFQTIAEIAVEEEEFVMMNSSSTPFKEFTSCKVQGEQMILTLEVKVNYTANVNEVCAKLQKKIHDAIEHMSGYAPDVIDIKVVGFFF